MVALNFVFSVGLVRVTLGGGGEGVHLEGMVGASDGLIDFGNPEIEIDEVWTDGETRTTEWDKNVIWVDVLFAFADENELEGVW